VRRTNRYIPAKCCSRVVESGKWRVERGESYELRVTSYELGRDRAEGVGEGRVTSYELPVTNWEGTARRALECCVSHRFGGKARVHRGVQGGGSRRSLRLTTDCSLCGSAYFSPTISLDKRTGVRYTTAGLFAMSCGALIAGFGAAQQALWVTVVLHHRVDSAWRLVRR